MGVLSWKIFAFLQKKCHQQMNKIILSKKFFAKELKNCCSKLLNLSTRISGTLQTIERIYPSISCSKKWLLTRKNIQTGLGPIAIRQPRIRHRDDGKFTSAILPPYLRRTQSIDAVIPALYLKGISTLDFPKL
jgi:transposase-like protein